MKSYSRGFRGFVLGCFLLFIIVGLLGLVSAITGSIGNGRMILRPEIGEKVEKYVRVINNNDVGVEIEVFASGDLAEDIAVIDDKFTLNAGEEKKAYFTINIKKGGKTESKINVKFTPIDGENGVGLSSTVIIIPEGSEEESDSSEDGDNLESNITILNKGPISRVSENASGKVMKNNLFVIISSFMTFVFLTVLLVLLGFQSAIKPKKSVRRNE